MAALTTATPVPRRRSWCNSESGWRPDQLRHGLDSCYPRRPPPHRLLRSDAIPRCAIILYPIYILPGHTGGARGPRHAECTSDVLRASGHRYGVVSSCVPPASQCVVSPAARVNGFPRLAARISRGKKGSASRPIHPSVLHLPLTATPPCQHVLVPRSPRVQDYAGEQRPSSSSPGESVMSPISSSGQWPPRRPSKRSVRVFHHPHPETHLAQRR